MKKILAILLTATMLLALVACGNKENSNDPLKRDDETSTPSQSTTDPGVSDGKAEDMDFGSILDGNGATDIVYGKMDDATKQALIEEAKKEGSEVSFGADGSMTITEQDGTVLTQKPDGTWVYTDANGGEGQVGGDWPDNEYTKLIPKPDFTILATGVEGNCFTAGFSGTTTELIKDYVEKVKDAGFTKNADTMDQDYAGMKIYSYSAYNASGYFINITLSGDMCSLSIEKQ